MYVHVCDCHAPHVERCSIVQVTGCIYVHVHEIDQELGV